MSHADGFTAGLVAGGMALVYWSRRAGFGLSLDRWLLSLPYFGGLMRMYATSQLMRTLSTLLAGGLPLVNALDVAAASIGNRAMAQAVGGATGRIREGASLTSALDSRCYSNVETLYGRSFERYSQKRFSCAWWSGYF